jgi:K+-transporting ATPase c subunit
MMEKKEEMGSISYEQWHKMGYDDSRRDDNNTTNTNNNNSIDNTIIAGSSNYDSSNNDELESIKKQIMDALERLEKDA